MTVWIYVDTRKQVGDKDYLKVFATEDAAERWFAERDPECASLRREPQVTLIVVKACSLRCLVARS
jgi:hypothetical protein